MTDQTQPWAERTVELSPQDNYRRGVAPVAPRTRPQTEPQTDPFPAYRPPDGGWPGQGPRVPRAPRQLRRGSGWTIMGGLFAFVCWGIWAISARGDLTSPVVTFVLSLSVAVGLFALSRLVGLVVLERQLGRVRRSARGSHLLTGLFLAGVGVAYLRQTEWVVGVWSWLSRLW